MCICVRHDGIYYQGVLDHDDLVSDIIYFIY